MSARITIAALVCLALAVVSGPATEFSMPTGAEISQFLQDAVEKEKRAPGIVAGIIGEKGTQVIACGTLKGGGSEKVDGDTIFEIGSITKVFTTLLLQDMVERGEVKLDDPIGKFLPASVKTPSRNGKEITLYHLATHTSGLPRLAFGTWYMIWHIDDPYAPFKVKDFYKFLSGYKLPRDVGAEFEYSNAGMALLGHLLCLKAGTNYETLVVQRICKPLGMDSTCITLSAEQKKRFAAGHDESGDPVKNWSPSDFPADGELRSSANDLLKFLAANMELMPSGLSSAMHATRLPREPTDDPSEKVGLGWMIKTNFNVVWHDGATQGYVSYIAFNPAERRGIVVLANSQNNIDDIGETLAGVRKLRKVAQVNHEIYSRYTGKYRLNDKKLFTVSRKGDRLFTQLTGQGKFEVFPESETEFFCKDFDAQLTFLTNGSGLATEVILHQSGKDRRMKKVK